MNCTPLSWSPSTADALSPTIIVCSIGLIIHALFWAQVLLFPMLRKRNMMWLYAYLATDCFLLSRFFVFYLLRRENACLQATFKTVLCYFEASSKFYMNAVQTYVILALNVCRYGQIVLNRDFYRTYPRLIILSHFSIGFLPAINVMVQFLANWTILWRRTGASCDIQYQNIIVQIFNLFVVYIIPIVLSLIMIAFSIRHVSSTIGIRSQQIINRRRKYQRMLLYQTIIFYSIWLILWSPYVLAFQFININTNPGIYTSLINFVEIMIDPIIVAALDIRFLKVWQTIWSRFRQHRIVPMVVDSN